MDSYLGQLQLFAFDFVPKGWARCEGQLLSIQQYQALFPLLGTTFGGDGVNTFGLPDLRGRAALGAGKLDGGAYYGLGQGGGAESVALVADNLPAHDHSIHATTGAANGRIAAGALLADTGAGAAPYAPDLGPSPATTADTALGTAGTGEPHPNMQPYLAMTWAIALEGIYPSKD